MPKGNRRNDPVLTAHDLGQVDFLVENVFAKGTADDVVHVAGEDEVRRFVDDAGDHQEGSGVIVFSAQFFQSVEQDLFLVEEVCRIHDLDLSHGKGRIAAGEFFHVVVDNLVRRQIGDVSTGFEHFHAVFFHVYASDVSQFFGSFAVSRRAGRRAEEDRIGNDRRQEQASDVFRDVDLSLFIQARDDGSRAADRFEEDGIGPAVSKVPPIR